jgi:cathepsin L
MKHCTLLLVLYLSLALSTPWYALQDYTFDQYKTEFNRNYDTEEETLRRGIFEAQLKTIHTHNANPSHTWKMGVNHFTDRTEEELQNSFGVKRSLLYQQHAKPMVVHRTPDVVQDLPASVDWRDKGIISNVKDQGHCGSCWSFATAEVTETYWALSTGKLNVLSEQQILDCTPNPNHCGGTGGCTGGTPEIAWDQISKMGGLSSEWTYPYTSYYGENSTCKTTQVTPIAKVSSYVNLPENEQDPILYYLATSGPLVASVDSAKWHAYETGIFNSCNKTNPQLGHAVMLIGYGTDPQFGDYWLIRNSWSPQWGEEGYIRLQRENPYTCGTDLNPSVGEGCTDGPPTITVCGNCGILYDTLYPIIST